MLKFLFTLSISWAMILVEFAKSGVEFEVLEELEMLLFGLERP